MRHWQRNGKFRKQRVPTNANFFKTKNFTSAVQQLQCRKFGNDFSLFGHWQNNFGENKNRLGNFGDTAAIH